MTYFISACKTLSIHQYSFDQELTKVHCMGKMYGDVATIVLHSSFSELFKNISIFEKLEERQFVFESKLVFIYFKMFLFSPSSPKVSPLHFFL